MVADFEDVAKVSQMVVCVMVKSLWIVGGLFIHLGMTRVDLGPLVGPRLMCILQRVEFVDSELLVLRGESFSWR